MVGIDLTVKGNNASNLRMVTEQTLDREGFFIPEPPQRYYQYRAKSALGIGGRDKRCTSNQVSTTRPKSALYHPKKECGPSAPIKHQHELENEPIEGNFRGFVRSAKMPVNQKWIHPSGSPKWKPRNSQVLEPKHNNKPRKEDVKQQISVCEVMEKMRKDSSENSGASAPPSSPKSSTSIVVGKRFVEECPMMNEQPSYISYAKSRTNMRNKKSLSYLQEDMTITQEPSLRKSQDIIEIPTMDMFSTDEPDEESVAIVSERKPTVTQSSLYESVYMKNYRDSTYNHIPTNDAKGIDRPKVDKNYVRYAPNTYRFKSDTRFTKDKVFHKLWDRKQLRAPVGNTRSVSACRPSHSLYTGVS